MSISVLQKTLEFISPLLDIQMQSESLKPLIIGIEGPQGSGKTTLSTNIKNELTLMHPNCNIVKFSMDDFYFTYAEQLKINNQNRCNFLLQGRGLPGTHDLKLLFSTFAKLQKKEQVDIPIYDKSAHGGKGDRLSFEHWIHITDTIDLVIFEGWFNGYPAFIYNKDLLDKWAIISHKESPKFNSLNENHIIQLNNTLKGYEGIWEAFDAFVCIKTPDLQSIYKWRLEQEHQLVLEKGSGMADEEVTLFVNKYMPVYQLYYDRLEITEKKVKKSIHLTIDGNRNLI